MFHVLKAGGGIVAGVAAAELIGSSVKEVIRGAKEANAHEPLRRPGIHVRDQ